MNVPATTLPDEFVNATFWNQPSLTSTLIGAIGTTSVAASAGWNLRRAAGASFFSACLVTVPAQAANTLGANTPSPRAARAKRRLIGGGEGDVLTTVKDTVRQGLSPATTIRLCPLLGC